MQIPAYDLARLLTQTRCHLDEFNASTICGIRLDTDGRTLHAIATDRYRIGPRRVGGRYRGTSEDSEYEVLNIDRGPRTTWPSWQITVRGEDGRVRKHCTGWDPRRDRIVVQPVDTATCVFCSIAAGGAPAAIVREWPDALAIRPRSGGVHESHVLILPRVHVPDAGTDPEVTATVMRRAAELMAEHPAANLITSKGAEATQTVYHLHIHIVPRQADDGLPLPWTPQNGARS